MLPSNDNHCVADNLSVDDQEHVYNNANPASSSSPTAEAGSLCPPFHQGLTQEELQPFILHELKRMQPDGCTALMLTHKLWPKSSAAIRPAMKTLVGNGCPDTLALVVWQAFVCCCTKQLNCMRYGGAYTDIASHALSEHAMM